MDPLYELLAPYFDNAETPPSHLHLHHRRPPPLTPQITSYFTHLSALSLPDLSTTEPAALSQTLQSHSRSLQALSKRSHPAVISSDTHLSHLADLFPALSKHSSDLQTHLPQLENATTAFAQKYDRSNSAENAVLDRRKKALLLARNVDRVTDVLDLPSLLSATVSAAQSTSTNTTTTTNTTSTSSSSSSTAATSYAAALDLHAHIKRLRTLYPSSSIVDSISLQSEAEIENLTTILITSLQSPSLKLAGAMRAIGWLRRVAPDLADDGYGAMLRTTQPTSTKALTFANPAPAAASSTDGALGALFLICRLRTLRETLEALEPLRELAEGETQAARRQGSSASSGGNNKGGRTSTPASVAAAATAGTQSERYLKRYIEIFREQSFSVVSMYKSIFPSGFPTPSTASTSSGGGGALPSASTLPPNDGNESDESDESDLALSALPSPLASFALQLVEMLAATLRLYLPNITDKSARESLLTQVLYCAGSLGRLGADFGMVLAVLQEDMVGQQGSDALHDGVEEEGEEEEEPEWVVVMKKHRVQAGRLEVLARGVGGAGKKKGSLDSLASPGAGGGGVVSPG